MSERVLLVGNGEPHQIGQFFRKALQELEIPFAFHDESRYEPPPGQPRWRRGLYRVFGRPQALQRFNRDLLETAARLRPTIIVVTKGAYIRPDVLGELRESSGAMLVNYATDDPFNPSASSPNVVAGIPLYDVYVTTKRAITEDLHRARAQRVVWVPFAYEPTLHYPEEPVSEDERRKWGSDVVFIGGADPDRIPFFIPLARDPALRLRVFGGYWGQYRDLRPAWGGFALGRDYRLALGGSKIAPCLVRRANRDGHVMRSFEVPACGAFLLAERTEEHLELFEEGKEMATFASPEELVDKVRYYLTHDGERRKIAEAGHRRVTGGSNTYRDRLNELLRHGAEARTSAPRTR